MNINKYICTGRLTKDPELRALPTGTSVCELRVAVDGMGRSREVGYINVSVFGKAGEAAAEYLSKGWLVAVDGRLEFGEWDTDAGGKRHDYSVVGNVEFLSAPRAGGEEGKRSPAAAGSPWRPGRSWPASHRGRGRGSTRARCVIELLLPRDTPEPCQRTPTLQIHAPRSSPT